MKIGIAVFMSVAAESFLVYAVFHFIREWIPALGTGRTRTMPVRLHARQLLPLDLMGPASIVVWGASGWNHYVYDALTATPKALARRR